MYNSIMITTFANYTYQEKHLQRIIYLYPIEKDKVDSQL